MERITSRRNERVQAASALHRKSERASQGRLLVEGPKCVELLLASDWQAEMVFFDERFLEKEASQRLISQASKAQLFSVTEEVIRKTATTDSPCSVVAVARCNFQPLKTLRLHPDGLSIVAHRTSDPGNLGTLLRVASAAGAEAVFVTGDACDASNPKVVRSSMGALFHVPVIVEPDIHRVLKKIKAAGVRTIAAEPAAETFYTEVAYSSGAAFVLGEEAEGLEPELLAQADERVRIPVAGPVESLNVAISGAILLYEARRRKECRSC